MKRWLKGLLVAGATAAALVGPAAAPAHAANCVGIDYNEYGPDRYVVWQCSCPGSPAGLGDGRLWVVFCFEI